MQDIGSVYERNAEEFGIHYESLFKALDSHERRIFNRIVTHPKVGLEKAHIASHMYQAYERTRVTVKSLSYLGAFYAGDIDFMKQPFNVAAVDANVDEVERAIESVKYDSVAANDPVNACLKAYIVFAKARFHSAIYNARNARRRRTLGPGGMLEPPDHGNPPPPPAQQRTFGPGGMAVPGGALPFLSGPS